MAGKRKTGAGGGSTIRVQVPPELRDEIDPLEDTETQERASPLPPLLRELSTLTVLAGPEIGRVLSLDGGDERVIGRGREANIILDDPGISRMHARVARRDRRVTIEDLGSTNGTYVEGKKVEAPTELKDGDRVQLGRNTVVRYSVQDPLERAVAEELHKWAVRDPLTGIHNRRFFEERLNAEHSFAQRHPARLSLLVIDVDHFKEVNDRHGHQAGDAVLSVIARFLQRIVRAEDVASRYGGEEFAILVREIEHGAAMLLAERIRKSIEGLGIPWENDTLKVTVSIGVATHTPATPFPDPKTLFSRADQALYRAKSDGRNSVRD